MTEIVCQSWNLWFGGARVRDGHDKIVATSRSFPADLCLYQETAFELAGNASRELGRNHAQQGWDTAVAASGGVELASTDTAPFATAAWLRVDGSPVLAWSVHLAPHDYGPYAALAGKPEAEVHAAPGEERRLAQIRRVLEETGRLLDGRKLPVIIGGDFNCPATADWVAREDRPNVSWPATDAVLAAGFVDAFRAVHSDPVSQPGDTWSPIEPADREPRDRIDFVFVRGFEPVSARTIGCRADEEPDDRSGTEASVTAFTRVEVPCSLIPDHAGNTYPSDHQLLETVLRLG